MGLQKMPLHDLAFEVPLHGRVRVGTQDLQSVATRRGWDALWYALQLQTQALSVLALVAEVGVLSCFNNLVLHALLRNAAGIGQHLSLFC